MVELVLLLIAETCAS